MPSLFGKAKPISGIYHQIEQSDSDLSETDEDEKVIFRKPGDLELNLYPDYKFKAARKKARAKARCRKVGWLVFSVVIVVVVLLALVAKFELSKGKTKEDCNTCDWNITIKDSLVENGLVLLDVDGDGTDDLIFSAANTEVMEAVLSNAKDSANAVFADQQVVCQTLGKEYPCSGLVYALRGYDGKVLWTMAVRGILFSMNCDEFDIDLDGKKDCIGSGRLGSVTAFNPYKGERLWMTESDQYLKPNWNTYQARALPDWDHDGVPEILIAHGGDPQKSAKEVHRASGRLVILSGASGVPMGDRYLEMPEDKETYMTPVLYRQMNTSTTYVLFGSGGETVPGNFMGISLADLCHYILGTNFTECPPKENLTWNHLEKDENGIFIIFRGERKGVMVPPVVLDVNKDGIMDIVASVYDGAVIMFDGQTMTPAWTSHFTNLESYRVTNSLDPDETPRYAASHLDPNCLPSTPCPGHFDDDGILDFMVHWNIGTWHAEYTGSMNVIISGKNGEVLWNTNSTKDIQAGSLAIQTKQHSRDIFLYRHIEYFFQESLQRSKRHGGSETSEPKNISNIILPSMDENFVAHVTQCLPSNSTMVEEVFLVDRTMVQNPLQVLKLSPEKYYYKPKDNSLVEGVNNHSDVNDVQGSHIGSDITFHDRPDHDNHDDVDVKDEHDEQQEGHHDEKTQDSDAGMHENKNKTLNQENISKSPVESQANSTDGVQKQGQGSTNMARKKRSNRKRSDTKWCSFQIPEGSTTGAIGDVDGDGLLDYISIVPYTTKFYDKTFYRDRHMSSMVIHKVSLEKHVLDNKLPSVHVTMTTTLSSGSHKNIPAFLPVKQQKWTKYMGSQGNNWYDNI